MASQFSTENATKLSELESHLANNLYLSGDTLPNQEDARILASLQDTPDRAKYPNLFAYWWNLCLFQANARELWGGKADAKGTEGNAAENKGAEGEKKPAAAPKKPVGKPAQNKAADEEDDDDVDDLDLFGGVTEEEKQALEDDKKQKDKKKEDDKKAKKAVIAKSRVTFDVKGYEVDQDFDALAKKIQDALKKDGLVWQDTYEIIPIGYGIKCLRLTMIIEDDKISTDDIFEFIQETYEEEVQSCDIHEFNKV